MLNPIFQIAADDDEKPFFNKPLRFQSPAIPNNWPPPIPTHPPDHTAPTHPPGYPGGIVQPTTPPPVHWPPQSPTHPPTPSWPPTPPTHPTQKPPTVVWPPTQQPVTPVWPPTQYPTVAPPNWPPPVPTHPPVAAAPAPYPTLPTTEKPVTAVEVSEPGIDYGNPQCGLKNGLEREEDRIVGGQNARPGEWPWIVSYLCIFV